VELYLELFEDVYPYCTHAATEDHVDPLYDVTCDARYSIYELNDDGDEEEVAFYLFTIT